MSVVDDMFEMIENVRNFKISNKDPRSLNFFENNVLPGLKEFEITLKSEKESINELERSEQPILKNIQGNLERLVNGVSSNCQDVVGKAEIQIVQILSNEIKQLTQSVIILKYLLQFSNVGQDIIICGTNGAGKSSFVSNLKSTYLNNLFVIPAEKYLFYNDLRGNMFSTKKEFNETQQTDPRKFYGQPSAYSGEYSDVANNILKRFTITLLYLVNKHLDQLNKNMKLGVSAKRTVFQEVSDIFSKIFPNLELNIEDTATRKLEVVNQISKKHYSVDVMSDGEKAALYYISTIMLVDTNSYIVADEPETFMNPVIYNKLWDLIQKARNDCQFIFVSHNRDFIESRINATILWVKDYTYPDKWNLLNVPKSDGINDAVSMALVGAKKPLLLCEGEQSSYDVKIFNHLFIDDFSVVPLQGHIPVINSTKAINDLKLTETNNKRAWGIVDGDGLLVESAQAQALRNKNIYILPFNEIEMLLITEPVMQAVLASSFSEEETKQKILEFKGEFLKVISREINIERIVINTITNRVNYKLGDLFMNRPKKTSELSEEWEKAEDDVKEIIKPDELRSEIKLLADEAKYEELLKYCNLKKEIIPGLTNRFLDSEYANRAIVQLSRNMKLCEELKSRYFAEIVSSLG